ncbi:MAG: flagellar type III secretion system pore protein FliP [Pseudohongiellaceae bacterium]
MKKASLIVFIVSLLAHGVAFSATSDIILLTAQEGVDGQQTYSVSLQILLFMSLLSMLPAAMMAMTSFTRIVIVLAILRQALGMMQTPSNQIIIGIALFITLFIMSPVFESSFENGIRPYMDETIDFDSALEETRGPFHNFMSAQVRDSDVALFSEMAGYETFASVADIPFRVLVPAFITSELKTAFQIGFLIFIPFLVIDLVVSSILMSMGMMMLSPMLISLPFKIMLFVMVDGWTLVLGTLAASFFVA